MEKTRVLPLKVLLTLTAAVLLAHLALLQAAPMTLGLSQPELARAFTTRAIAPAPTPASVQPLATPVPSPQRPVPTSARAEKPAPAATSAEFDPENSPMRPQDATYQDEPPQPELLAAATPAPPSTPLAPVQMYTVPGSVRLKYQVGANKFPFSLSGELQWQQDGASYDARLAFSAFGQARVQTSRGQITAQGLAPIRFSDKYRSEVAAHFNREQGKVTFSANTPDVPLQPGGQDHLSILVQLAALIGAEPSQYPPGVTLSLQAIGPRDGETWLFTVGKVETLSLPGGEQLALKLVRSPRQELGQKLELWLAPALGYLPARVLLTEPNGDYLDQKWLATETLN